MNKRWERLSRLMDPLGWQRVDEIRRLRAENEAMRPVVAAAQMWACDEGGGAVIDGEWYAVESLCEALAEAVDTYNARQHEHERCPGCGTPRPKETALICFECGRSWTDHT